MQLAGFAPADYYGVAPLTRHVQAVPACSFCRSVYGEAHCFATAVTPNLPDGAQFFAGALPRMPLCKALTTAVGCLYSFAFKRRGRVTLARSAALHCVMQGLTEPRGAERRAVPLPLPGGQRAEQCVRGQGRGGVQGQLVQLVRQRGRGQCVLHPGAPHQQHVYQFDVKVQALRTRQTTNGKGRPNLADPACICCVRPLCGARCGKEPCACELAPHAARVGGCQAPAVGNLHLHQPLRTCASAERAAALHPHAYSGSPDHGRLHTGKGSGDRWLKQARMARKTSLVDTAAQASASSAAGWQSPGHLARVGWPWWHSRRSRGPLPALRPVGF